MLCGGVFGNLSSIWVFKNGFQYAKPIEKLENRDIKAKNIDNRMLNIVTVAGMVVFSIVALECAVLFMVIALNRSANTVNIFTVWGTGAVSSGLIFLLRMIRKKAMKK